jgi:ABC-2 type transport system permease protein
MNKTFRVMKHEFIKLVKSKGYIIITLLFPLLSLLALGGYQLLQGAEKEDTADKVINIGYVDEIGNFNDNNQIGDIAFIEYQIPSEAIEDLLEGNIDEYFIIPADYLQSGRIERYILERELEMSPGIIGAVRQFLLDNMLQGQISDEMLERTKAPAWFMSTRLDETGEVSPEQGGVLSVFVVPYVFSLLFWIAILTCSFTLMEGLGEEKENRIMEILLSSVSIRQLLLGKIIGLGTAGLLQILFWFISASFIVGLASSSLGGMFTGLEIPVRLIIFGAVYFILGYLLFAVLFSCLGALTPTYREGQQLAFFIIIPGIMPLMLIYFLVDNPDHLFTYIVTFFPISIPIASMIRLAVGTIPVWQIVINIILLVLSTAGLFFLGARIFRSFLLMYGKRPALKEIISSLRQA